MSNQYVILCWTEARTITYNINLDILSILLSYPAFDVAENSFHFMAEKKNAIRKRFHIFKCSRLNVLKHHFHESP